MKKISKLLVIIVSLVLMSTMLFACVNSTEKEKIYYEKIEKDVNKVSELLCDIASNFSDVDFESNFLKVRTYYDSVKRGSFDEGGWGEKGKWISNVIEYSIINSSKKETYVKAVEFENMEKETYLNNYNKKNYGGKFVVKDTYELKLKNDEIEYFLKNGKDLALVDIPDYLSMVSYPMFIMSESTNTEHSKNFGLSAYEAFKVYTHVLRLELRTVYDLNGKSVTYDDNKSKTKNFLDVETITKSNDGIEYNPITIGDDYKYWEKFGEDISYNWEKVHYITNQRFTVLYDKGEKQMSSFEYYEENVMSYFTKKDKVNTYNVLKADVVDYTEMVITFNYPKDGITMPE